MSKLKVVIDASPLLNPNVGIGRTTQEYLREVFSEKREFDFLLYARRLLGPSIKKYIGHNNYCHFRVPRFAESLLKSTGLVEAVCRGDLYHATDFYLPVGQRVKTVATVHDLIFEIDPEPMVDHVRMRENVRPFVKNCQRVIAISENTKKDLVENYHIEPEKIDVIYWGVNRNVFFPVDSKSEARETVEKSCGLIRPYFLAVSCSTGRKNTMRLLKAYSKMVKSGPEHDLVLVWNAPDEVRASYQTGESGSRIHFLPYQDNASLRALYAGAIATVYPSLYEGFGLPVLESMSCGTPVITSENSSLPEVGGDAAIYVDPTSVTSIRNAMEQFENDAFDLQSLEKKSIKQASRFSWNDCVKETMQTYRKCLEQ